MSADIMPALPFPPRNLARRGRDEFSDIAHLLPRSIRLHEFALAAREAEASIDERGTETPLRDHHPPKRHHDPAEC